MLIEPWLSSFPDLCFRAVPYGQQAGHCTWLEKYLIFLAPFYFFEKSIASLKECKADRDGYPPVYHFSISLFDFCFVKGHNQSLFCLNKDDLLMHPLLCNRFFAH